jgi:hypothetical protein
MRVLRETGRSGGDPNDGLLCDKQVDQGVHSSPAVGRIGGRNELAAVFGTGDTFPGGDSTNRVYALDVDRCQFLWRTAPLDAPAKASPALADLYGDGKLHVVLPTKSGWVYALAGGDGHTLWKAKAKGVFVASASVVTADLRSTGHQDVIVASAGGVEAFDGRTGTKIGELHDGTNYPGFQNTPLVTRDPNGRIGITVAGYNSQRQGVIQHYEVANSDGNRVKKWGAWPVFHHDSQLTGNAGELPRFAGISSRLDGSTYRLARSDARVFLCGPSACAGPAGTRRPKVVGVAQTPSGGGYWLTDTAGRVFRSGNAGNYGSIPSKHIKLQSPISGIAATPSGNGFWLVSVKGGVFTFGGARFKGSMAGRTMNAFVVALTPTPTGNGYWLAASDGGVFTFGDARFYGSAGAARPPTPVVGMARTPGGKGYWLVTAGGRVFAFGAAGHYGDKRGSPAAITGIASSPTGRGYWLLGAKGRVFQFGDAPYRGSGSQ